MTLLTALPQGQTILGLHSNAIPGRRSLSTGRWRRPSQSSAARWRMSGCWKSASGCAELTAKRSRSVRRARQLPGFFRRSTIVRTESGPARERRPESYRQGGSEYIKGPPLAERCPAHLVHHRDCNFGAARRCAARFQHVQSNPVAGAAEDLRGVSLTCGVDLPACPQRRFFWVTRVLPCARHSDPTVILMPRCVPRL